MIGVSFGGEVGGDDRNVGGEGPQVETADRDHVLEPEQLGVDGVVVEGGGRPFQQNWKRVSQHGESRTDLVERG